VLPMCLIGIASLGRRFLNPERRWGRRLNGDLPYVGIGVGAPAGRVWDLLGRFFAHRRISDVAGKSERRIGEPLRRLLCEVDLDAQLVPPYTGGPSIPFAPFEGQVRWVGPATYDIKRVRVCCMTYEAGCIGFQVRLRDPSCCFLKGDTSMIARRWSYGICGVIILLSFDSAFGAVLRVSTTGTGNGSTWGAPCSLDYALANAVAGDSIWVRAGTYHRGAVGPVLLEMGVTIIGGFAGTEMAASQSNPAANVTTIDGDNVGRAVESYNDYDPNDPANVPLLRGFTIANGYRPEQGVSGEGGGGMLLDHSRALIVQCQFVNNHALWTGAAVTISGESAPWFVNCTFRDNGSGTPGPARDVTARPYAGGAVYVWAGAPTFVNSLFYNNVAAEAGALELSPYYASFTFVNCTFVKNRTKITYGAAVLDLEGHGNARNCIFWDNTVPPGQPTGPIFSAPWSQTTVRYSDVQGGWPGTGNINTNPLFVNSGANNYRLQSTSPCKDTGISMSPALADDLGDLDWDALTSEPTPQDLDRNQRRVGIFVDMGAFENQNLLASCNASSDCMSGRVCCSNICEACCTDSNCQTSPYLHCKTGGANACVECLDDSHCTGGKKCCDDGCYLWCAD